MVEFRQRVQRVRKIKGRYYWWPTAAIQALGFASEPLGSDLDAAIARANHLNAQVKAIQAKPEGERDASVRPGSVAALIRAYRKSPVWEKKLAEETKVSYGAILDRIERTAGNKAVSAIGRGDMVQVYEKLVKRGLSLANAHMRIWRILFNYAISRGERLDNPASRMQLVTPKARRVLWTGAEIERFATTALSLGRPSMALAVLLAYEIGQRQTDVRRLSYEQWRGTGFLIEQSKTTVAVWAPVRPKLAKMLNKGAKAGGYVVIAEGTGQPYKRYHFQHEFARIRQAAGLDKRLWFRDIRRTVATELGSAGSTDDEIRGVTGHKTRNQVAAYVVTNREMAETAQRKRWAKPKKLITPRIGK